MELVIVSALLLSSPGFPRFSSGENKGKLPTFLTLAKPHRTKLTISKPLIRTLPPPPPLPPPPAPPPRPCTDPAWPRAFGVGG